MAKKIKNSKEPLITVITAVLNGAETFERTLKSIAGQTYKNFEYIVKDGCSKDGTLGLIKKYAKHIDKWVSEPDKSLFDAENIGIKMAKGEYIYFLPADDYFLNPYVLEKIAKDLEKHKPEVAYAQVIFPIDANNFMIWPTKEVTLRKIRMGQTLPQQGLFMKRKLLLQIGLHDLNYPVSGDRDIICKGVKHSGEPFFLPYPITFFEAGGTSSGFNVNETARVISANFGLLNAAIFYLTYSPLIFLRYFLGRISLFRKSNSSFLVFLHKSFFRHLFPFIRIVDKNYLDNLIKHNNL
jgi:glycosyltransferase involved in cell wall biosynthesis